MARLRHDRRAHLLRPHPLARFLRAYFASACHEAHLGQHRLEAALAEVGAQRLGDVGLVLAHHALDLGELARAATRSGGSCRCRRSGAGGPACRAGRRCSRWISGCSEPGVGRARYHSRPSGAPAPAAAARRKIGGDSSHRRGAGSAHDRVDPQRLPGPRAHPQPRAGAPAERPRSRNSRSRTTRAAPPWSRWTPRVAPACCGSSGTRPAAGSTSCRPASSTTASRRSTAPGASWPRRPA